MVDKRKFAEEEALGYNITIVGKSVQVTDAMKNYLWDKITKIERFHRHIMHVQATMDMQKIEHTVTLLVKIDHIEIKVSATSTDMYASIDEATHRLRTKLARWKDKIQDHHKKDLTSVDIQVNVIGRPYDEISEYNKEIEEELKNSPLRNFPKIIGSETMKLKVLTGDEAVMKMELSENPLLVYRDEIDRKLKVLYRRHDGNYGVIQPE